MKNKNTSRGWIFDLVNGFGNDLATTNHLHENVYAAQTKLEQMTDDTDGQEVEYWSDKQSDYEKLLGMSLNVRRRKMRYLASSVESFDEKMWCVVKHTTESYIESMEVWQATGDQEAADILKDSTDLLSGVLSVALNMELETCARCLADKLRESESESEDASEIID